MAEPSWRLGTTRRRLPRRAGIVEILVGCHTARAQVWCGPVSRRLVVRTARVFPAAAAAVPMPCGVAVGGRRTPKRASVRHPGDSIPCSQIQCDSMKHGVQVLGGENALGPAEQGVGFGDALTHGRTGAPEAALDLADQRQKLREPGDRLVAEDVAQREQAQAGEDRRP